MRYNREAIRKLILEAFSDEELVTFCSDQFREAADSFSPQMGTTQKVFLLVEYCDRREGLALLLEKVKAKRPGKFDKYQDQLEVSELAPSVLEEIRAETSQYADVLEAMSPTTSPRRQPSEESRSGEETDHPLSGNELAVKQWFLKELSSNEQAFVMTAALFSGLERQELMEIYNDVLSIVQPSEAQTEGGTQDG